MSDPRAPALPHPAPASLGGPEDLHIVLFGMPAAGKSSLLGALGQAARTQEHLLNGRLIDRGNLGELAQRLYEEAARRTADEVVPYPLSFEPFSRDGKDAAQEKLDAVVIDCDGRVANDLLVRRQELDEESPEGTLAHEVVDADALVLVIDASAPPAQVETDFGEFDRFLRQMERGRAKRAEVAGLPVFLVLTKCDLLAQARDNSADWMERIEQRKRDVDARFRSFLARRVQEGAAPPFGRLDLHIWATAVKRPPLAGTPARPREPYGVAELFRQCLEEAAAYRAQHVRSQRRLGWTVGIAGTLVLAMGGLTVGLVLHNRAGRADALHNRVEDFRLLDSGGPAERLRGSVDALRRKLDTLQSIRDHALFGGLPSADQAFVQERLDEVRAYLAFLEALRQEPSPSSVRSESALKELEKRLHQELALPRPEWADTEAGQLHRRRLAEIAALRKAVQRAEGWYRDRSEEAGKLWTFADEAGIDWPDWTAQVEKLLDPKRKPPFGPADVIPGTSFTSGTALRFEKVVDACGAWEEEKKRLKRLLNLTSALGLATPSKDRSPVLVVPAGCTLGKARTLFAQLRTAYPNYRTDFVPEGLPDAVLPKIKVAARRSYAALLPAGQAEVLRQLKAGVKGKESAAGWEGVRRWLGSPRELEGWDQLAAVLARLANPDAEDPVRALASFLGRDRFLIEVRTVKLEVPERLGVRPRSDARLAVYHPASDRQPALVFEPSDDPRRDARKRVWTYTYRLAEGRRIRYQPGDKLWAELPLPEKRVFTWSEARSARYQFERLRQPPRLQRASDRDLTAGPLQKNVVLSFRPEDGVPRVPDLLPRVRLDADE
jgi:hypothetical protein